MQGEKHLVGVFYLPSSDELTPTTLLRRADATLAHISNRTSRTPTP